MKINIAIFLFMPFILYSQIDSVLIQIKRSNQLSEFSGIVACYNLDSNNYLFLKSANLSNERIDTSTLFNIGSISKIITGLLIYNSIIENKISLETNVSEILNNKIYGDLKIKHLLTHTSGFTRLEGVLNPKKIPTNVETNNKYLSLMLSNEKYKLPTQTKYIYSNHNYHLLAIILEKIYTKKYEEILKDFFNFINIQKSDFSYCFPNFSNVAEPYYLNNKLLSYKENKTLRKFIEMDSTYGSGKIYSSVSDIVLISKYIFLNRNLRDSFVLNKPKFIQSIKSNRTYLMEYAILDNQDTVYYHGGNSYGYNALFGINYKKGNVYIVLSNIDSQLENRTIYETIFKLLINAY
jgi:hypothetical protein